MTRRVQIHALQVDAGDYTTRLIKNDNLDVVIKSRHEHFWEKLNIEDRWGHRQSALLHHVAQIDGETPTLHEVLWNVNAKLGAINHPTVVLDRKKVF